MQISQIWMQIKDILSVFVKQWVLFHHYPEHQLFFSTLQLQSLVSD